MKYNRPIVFSIAGFDPTGGAGVLADIKTMERLATLGMGILTGTTIQTESEFREVHWLGFEEISSQLDPLLTYYRPGFIKIGIIEHIEVLQKLIGWIKKRLPEVLFIWDPVLAATSGFELHSTVNRDLLESVLKEIYLITPNVPEIRKLAGLEDEVEAAFYLGNFTNVLLKGGHSAVREGVDVLIQGKRPLEIGTQTAGKKTPKHGSGCILSSAITANLALGDSLQDACTKGKKYVEERLKSNPHLLAYHVA